MPIVIGPDQRYPPKIGKLSRDIEFPMEDLGREGLFVSVSSITLDEITITYEDYPPCFDNRDYSCQFCEFFSPLYCRIKHYPYIRQEVELAFKKILTNRTKLQQNILHAKQRKESLTNAIYSELKSHGRPLHFSYVGKMIRKRHSTFEASDHEIVSILNKRSDLFSFRDVGVYAINGSIR